MSVRSRKNRSRFYTLLLVLILLTSGCMVGPNFNRPKVEVSPNWLDAGDQRVKTEPSEYRNWWQAFNDPVLDRLIDRAYRENLSLRIAGVRVLQARAQLGIAIGGLFPQTQQASGFLQYNRISQSSPLAGAFSKFTYSQDQVGINASWELDFWGRFRRTIESADASWLATVADYDNALVSLTSDVANSYILIRTLERRIDIAHQNVETQRESLKIAEARFQYGTASELDVEQAKTVLNNTLASIPTLETQLRQAKDALSILLGLPPSNLADFLEGPSEIPVSPPQVAVGIPADLLRRRSSKGVKSVLDSSRLSPQSLNESRADLTPFKRAVSR